MQGSQTMSEHQVHTSDSWIAKQVVSGGGDRNQAFAALAGKPVSIYLSILPYKIIINTLYYGEAFELTLYIHARIYAICMIHSYYIEC